MIWRGATLNAAQTTDRRRRRPIRGNENVESFIVLREGQKQDQRLDRSIGGSGRESKVADARRGPSVHSTEPFVGGFASEQTSSKADVRAIETVLGFRSFLSLRPLCGRVVTKIRRAAEAPFY